MPAEWEKHEGTWLVWPKNLDTFAEEGIGRVRMTYVKFIEALGKGETVHLLVDDDATKRAVVSAVGSGNRLVFHAIRSADVWIRDYGPIFVRNGEVALTKWVFNSWGNRYDDLRPDNETGLEVARTTGLRVFETGRVLEGGSVDANGAGTLLTTTQCLMNQNRNPGLTREQVEAVLRDHLGATKVIWLESGILGDDTDGHVDDIARFVAPHTVVCMVEKDRDDPNHEPLAANLEVLRSSTTADGRRLKVVPIDMPSPFESEDGRLPASYANFYVGNEVVLVPTFADPNDRKAVSSLSKLFPERKVLGVDCRDLVRGFGAIHCVTQQQPTGRQ